MTDKIKTILNTAVYAPSGDNSQPWRFKVLENALEIYNLPKRDNEIFNYEQRGSYIAHGTLIENISILANNIGLLTQITIFPKNDSANLVAKINFFPAENCIFDPLGTVIKNRSTNRKKYSNRKLSTEEKNIFFDIFKKDGFGKLIFVENEKEIRRVASAASAAERTMLEYKPLHDMFYNLLLWRNENKIGMNVKTLELEPPQKIIFKLFSYWPIDRIFSFLKLPAIVAKENSKIYAQCAAIGGIIYPATSSADYIKTGRLLQRIWLTATSLNLSIQPITGVLYLEQSLRNNKMPGLKSKWQKLIINAKKTINENFGHYGDELVLIFRIGQAINPPSAKSIKLPPEITN